MSGIGLDLTALSEQVRLICEQAGRAIVEVYSSEADLVIETKADSSPLTIADRLAHDIITAGLNTLDPQIPILSEEQKPPPFSERCRWHRYWLVDPLDGTREFVERTGEFTVNVALIEDGRPILGVVSVPLSRDVYIGVPALGLAQKVSGEAAHPIEASSLSNHSVVKVLTSSRYGGESLDACMRRLQQRFSKVEHLKAGSALKFCYLAEGLGDIYPRFSPCCEWDTAAGQAVLEAAGGQIVDMAFQPLSYNQQASLLSVHFYALSNGSHYWKKVLSV